MLLNKYDWKSFFHSMNPFWAFNRMMVKDTKGGWIKSCIVSLIFYGGKMCPNHGRIDCKTCKPKKFCYFPWSQEDLKQFEEEDKEFERSLFYGI
uniref:Uncharacterized protein n=1 Tax=viral metagenome TaxID=1070528 RepID=A0A6M3LR45_9ZZZZ